MFSQLDGWLGSGGCRQSKVLGLFKKKTNCVKICNFPLFPLSLPKHPINGFLRRKKRHRLP